MSNDKEQTPEQKLEAISKAFTKAIDSDSSQPEISKKWDETDLPPLQKDEMLDVKPQIVYGISIFFMTDNKLHVEVTGSPSMLELQMLLGPALANIEGDITARKAVDLFVQKIQEMQAQQRIIKPSS